MVASIGESKRTLATRLTTVCKCLRLFCKRLRLFCKRLRLFCKRLQLFAEKINSQRTFEHVQNFFATRKTVCDNKNCLRTCLQPFTNPDETQNSLRSQTFAAQCDVYRTIAGACTFKISNLTTIFHTKCNYTTIFLLLKFP